jgi:hypothetical protein
MVHACTHFDDIYRLCLRLLSFFVRVMLVALLRAVAHNAQYGSVALMYAAREGHADCVRLLIDAGADKDASNNVRRRSLPSTCFFSLRVLFILIEWFPIFKDTVTAVLSAFLFFCLFPGRAVFYPLSLQVLSLFSKFTNSFTFEMLSFVVCEYAGAVSCCEIDSQLGYTALMGAARNGRADCVQLLIDAGADKDIRSEVRSSRCLLALAPSCLCLHLH